MFRASKAGIVQLTFSLALEDFVVHNRFVALGCSLVVVVGLALSGLAMAAKTAVAQPSKVPPALSATEVSFSSRGFILHGTVLAPRSFTTRRPGLVLVHGSGTGVPRNKLLQEAEAFAAGGVVTLIYDKRAAGYSARHRDFSRLADDALAAVALLQTRPEVDPANVGLWGRSEGGWVAPMAAARSADVAFLVVVGANGIAPARQQAWALSEWQHHLGVSGSMEESFPTTATRLLVGAGLIAQADHDPVPVLERVHQPVLGIWGGKDRLTPPGEGLTMFRQVLSSTRNPHYTLRVFPDGDHAIHRSTDDGFDRLDDLLPGYADLVTSWVTAVAAGHAPAPSTDVPPRQDRSSPVLRPLAWWESPWLQLAAMVLFTVAFLAYLVLAIARRIRLPRIPRPTQRLGTAGPGDRRTIVAMAGAPTSRRRGRGNRGRDDDRLAPIQSQGRRTDPGPARPARGRGSGLHSLG
jgi:uncharacterized protein